MIRALRRRDGTSMIETLVVLAIIMVLMTILVPALTRALRMAKSTAAGEEARSDRVGEIAVAAHEGRPDELAPEQAVARARDMFRHEVRTRSVPRVMSAPLFIVRNDAEFRAYWYTLLNPQNTETPEFTRSGELIAFTPEGQRHELPPVGGPGREPDQSYIVRWEFMSTKLHETGRGDLGGNVIYSDGRREYMPYPTRFPMTQQVAELSHRFYVEVFD
jgi:type II secretory pathway pseudopilin PulG